MAPPAPADSRHLPVFLALTYSDFSCLSYLWNAKLLNQGLDLIRCWKVNNWQIKIVKIPNISSFKQKPHYLDLFCIVNICRVISMNSFWSTFKQAEKLKSHKMKVELWYWIIIFVAGIFHQTFRNCFTTTILGISHFFKSNSTCIFSTIYFFLSNSLSWVE